MRIEFKVGREDWLLTSDHYNFIVGKKVWNTKKVKGETVRYEGHDQNTKTFHGTLESVMKKIRDLKIKKSTAKTLEDLSKDIKLVNEEIHEMYKDFEKVPR